MHTSRLKLRHIVFTLFFLVFTNCGFVSDLTTTTSTSPGTPTSPTAFSILGPPSGAYFTGANTNLSLTWTASSVNSGGIKYNLSLRNLANTTDICNPILGTSANSSGYLTCTAFTPGSAYLAKLYAENDQRVLTPASNNPFTIYNDYYPTGSLFKDIQAGATGSSISGIVATSSAIFFGANDGINGGELWKSDGTLAGSVL